VNYDTGWYGAAFKVPAGTCYNTCGDTCPATCETCYDTCGKTCPATCETCWDTCPVTGCTPPAVTLCQRRVLTRVRHVTIRVETPALLPLARVKCQWIISNRLSQREQQTTTVQTWKILTYPVSSHANYSFFLFLLKRDNTTDPLKVSAFNHSMP
jgi:hypothetical protein